MSTAQQFDKYKHLKKMRFASSGAMAYRVNTLYPVFATKRNKKSWTECMKQLLEDSEK